MFITFVFTLKTGVEDDEAWNERRRLKVVEVASAVERARQRKEEEEKRYQESTRQAAAKKLQDLEQKLKEKQANESKGLISVPPVPIPVPEWERERENRERENRERERSEGKDEKSLNRELRETRDGPKDNRDSRDQLISDFRQGDRQSFTRQDSIRSERDRERDRDRDQRDTRDRELHASSSRYYKTNLPPRFQKQQAEKINAGLNRVFPNNERSTTQSVPFSQQYDPGRWVHTHSSLSKCNYFLAFSMISLNGYI